MSEKNKMGPEPENRSLTQPNKKRKIKNHPARFARRMASFPYVLLLLDTKCPKIFRRASRAGWLQFPK